MAWWDPRALTLNVPQSFGIRQEELLKESDDPEVLKKDLETYKSWRDPMGQRQATGCSAGRYLPHRHSPGPERIRSR